MSLGTTHMHNLPCIELKCIARRTSSNNNICKITALEKILLNIQEFEANLDSRLIERVKDIFLDNIEIFYRDFKERSDEFKKDMLFVREPFCRLEEKLDLLVNLNELVVSPIKFKLGLYSPSVHRYFPKRLTIFNYDPDRFSNLPPMLEYIYGCLETAYTPPAATLNFS